MQIRILFSALMALLMTAAGSTAVHAQAVSGQGTWETTLQARDVGNTGTTNAFYDTALGVTWLRDANVNGQMDWNTATSWASNLTVGGVSGWRLPTMAANPNDSFVSFNGSTADGYNVSGGTSEMANLFYNTLGNKAYFDTNGNPQAGYGLTNTGGFQNMQSSAYWLGTEYAPATDYAWYFGTYYGVQSGGPKNYHFDAMAVHSGDVGTAVSAVPEPETYAMLLAGLGLMAFTLRSRRGVSPSVPLQRFKDQGRDATGVPIF